MSGVKSVFLVLVFVTWSLFGYEISLAGFSRSGSQCVGRPLEVQVNEGLTAGNVLFKFKQDDNIRYTLHRDSALDLFQISPQGIVTNIVTLDREGKRGSRFTLIVLAKHIARSSQAGWSNACSLTITLLDRNDNSPQFKMDLYVGNVQENLPEGAVVQGLQGIYATDQDIGVNTVHSYKILPGNGADKFEADTEELSGVKFLKIRTKVSLNREESSFYVITVRAVDGGEPARTARTQIRINIEDTNDCSPKFFSSEYWVSVLATTSVSTEIFKVHAQDCDYGENAEIYYFFKFQTKSQSAFTLDPHTGAIRVARSLASESLTQIPDLIVVAQDRGKPAKRAETVVKIVLYRADGFSQPVKSFSTQSPRFLKRSYLVRIREDLPVNSHILHPDVANLARSKYQPKFSVLFHEPIPFEVDANGGFLYLVKNLDFETRRVYEVRVMLLTSLEQSEVNVTVLVDDANENTHAPMFEKTNKETKMNRNWKLSHLIEEVKAIDTDEGRDGKVNYYLVDGHVGKFSINKNSGRVFSEPGLNWDGDEQLGLVVEARDSAARWKSSKQFLLINVVGLEDCAPVFDTTLYQGNVRENLPRGTFVVVTRARMCQGHSIVYSITDGNSRNCFKIDKNSGVVSTTKTLDREEWVEYTLEITASSGSRSSKALVVINIDDVNDQAPVFTRKQYQVEITENRGKIKNLLCLVARDKDGGDNAKVKYSISHGNRILFHIDVTSGTLSSESLNFEDNRVHSLTVKATDYGDPPRSSYATVQVLVKNVNDPPKFESSEITVNILEEQPANTRVVLLSVVDEDVGKNGEFDCSYENIDAKEFGKFRVLTTSTGCEIQNNELLKWFEGSSYSLRVRVADKASPLIRKSDVVTVNVEIKDVNNHDPMFLQDSYFSSVTPGATYILTVAATDKDSGRNARIRYLTTSKIFHVHPTTGKLTSAKRKLHVRHHEVHVYAEDQGSPKRRTKVTCYVAVGSSRFRERVTFSKQNPKLYENVSVNTVVTTVHVSKPGGKFIIVGGNTGGAFIISQDGRVRVASTLDYEKVKEYKLVIRITYELRQGLELGKEKHLNVEILDINDNEPSFRVLENPLMININTPLYTGSLITKVLAYDADSANTVTYSLKSSSSPVPFDINPISGEITAQTLVQSRSWPYSFTVVAKDGGIPWKSSELEVHVRILGDHSTLKIPEHQVKVDEGPLGIGKDITSFAVKKSGEQDLVYSITKGNFEDVFCIDVTGSLYAAKELDREVRADYLLSVSVDDGKSSETSHVNVIVNDINDNRPQFSSDAISIFNDVISIFTDENKLAQKIWTFNAGDRDSGVNGNLTYGIVETSRSSYSNVFAMDHGILMITRALNHEEAPRHMLTIVAADQGSPSHKTFVRAIVNVRDQNDNNPLFLSRDYAERVPLHAPRGFLILRTLATDKDSGRNGQISYIIHPSSEMFAIDEVTGWIKVATELTHGRFEFNVTAKDHGTPRRSNTVPVSIIVDVSAGPPRFIYAGFPRGFHASVHENERSRTKVLSLTAVSQDLVTYAMYETNVTDFIIDPISGVISTTKSLDYEDIKYYEFTVSATDRSERVSLAHVSVSVVNVNDNKPIILNKNYHNEISCRISRDTTVGALLIKVQAQDADHDHLTFSLTQSSKPVLFRHDMAGNILVAGSLHDIKDRIYLAVTVRDSGGLEDTVVVNVVAVNHVGRAISAQVSEDTSIGKNILFSPAEQIQSRYKNPHYTIIYPLQSPFTILGSRGNISLKARLDYEVRRNYSLTVRVQNPGNKNEYFDVDITIEVKDENDNQPEFVSPGILTGCKDRPMFKIDENAQRGSLVYKFEASDKDSGLNGEIFYDMERCKHCTNLFALDRNSGALETTGVTLTKPQYEVDVIVYDKGIPAKSSRGCILVQAGHQKPEFTKEEYHFEIDESAGIGQRVGVVEARGFGDTVTYDLRTPNIYFSLNPTTGVLSVISSLDHENNNGRRIELDVETKRKASTAKVIIHVRDVNDCPPKFDKQTYTDHVPETAPVGSTLLKLHASDGDSGLNADIRYSLDNRNFIVDAYTGVVSTAALLDFETKRVHSMTVTAHDRGSPSLMGRAQLVINIDNVNDNTPAFTSPEYSCSIWENTKAGSELTTVMATDADGNKVIYDITSGNRAGIFIMDPDSGVLQLTNDKSLVLIGPTYILNISATDGVYWGHSMIKVNIKDINDHTPVFTECDDYHPSIPEDSPLHTTVLQVSATDKDLGTNGQVEYAIVYQQYGKNFEIDEKTGRIETKAKFDRTNNRKFVLLVKATDGNDLMKAEERLEGSCSIEVTITDVNDNKPVFENSSYTQSISENVEIGHRILKVRASDRDEGLNAKITYSLEKHSSLFSVEAHTGVIKTRARLINKKNKYLLKILASDHGHLPLVSKVDVTINVIESNDEPQFGQSFYEVTIPENFAKLGIVANITATSRKPDYHVYYRFVGDSTPDTNSLKTFTIDTIDKQGVVRVSGLLDRETTQIYTLTICAELVAEQLLSSYATLRVVLTDVNDCPPEFTHSRYVGAVSENERAGTVVLTVSALDRDFGSDTEYSMLTGKKDFSIHPKTGVIQSKRVFNREKKHNYLFQVQAKDKDKSSFSSRAIVHVTITDVNDLPPVFNSKHYQRSVKENEVNGTIIGTVTATDGDQNAKITYTMKHGNIDGMFRIDPDTGHVFVNGNIDYEVRKGYELVLAAWDGKHEDTTRMIVTVKNENDNNPRFETSAPGLHEAFVLENCRRGTLVTSLKAHDPDAQWITYELSDQIGNVFGIFPNTSQVITKTNLDREVTDTFTFEAYARDQDGRTGTVRVKVHVIDENDNPPIFQETSLEMSVVENAVPGTAVGTIQATDLDDVTSGNGKVYYGIVMDPFDAFSIDNNTGDLTTTVVLDREKRSTYSLTVTATDGGKPSKSTRGDVIIKVLDTNDNGPKFSKSIYEKSIAENASIGLPILQLAASDGDVGINANLSFTMLIQKEFRVDVHTGIIKLAAQLDYEKVTKYEFDVQVEDGGDPKLSDEATVIIKVTDSNDCPPRFSKSYDFVKPEGYRNEKLGDVEADDADGTRVNTELRYSIHNDADNSGAGFFVDPVTGELFVNTTLDFEEKKEHTFKLRATNLAFPYLESETEVKVKVTDLNDNPPELVESSRDQRILENSTVDGIKTPVGELVPYDPDEKPNGAPFIFKLHNWTNLFSLDPQTGLLSTVSNFDREAQAMYVLEVSVRDNGTPALTNNITVRVRITDRNDNQHKEGYLELSVNIFDKKAISPRAPIGQVFVDDPDTDDLRYYDVITSDTNAFGINRYTGNITMNIQPSQSKEYKFRVKVSDRNSTFHPVECQVNIKVNIIPLEAESRSIALRFQEMTAAEFVSNIARYKNEIAKALKTVPRNVDIFSVQRSGSHLRDVDVRLAAHGSPYYAPERLISILKRQWYGLKEHFQNVIVGYDACAEEPCESGGCKSEVRLTGRVVTVDNGRGKAFGFFETEVDVKCQSCQELFPVKSSCRKSPCLNSGVCQDIPQGYLCKCPRQYQGPNCELTTRSFKPGDWVWLRALKSCRIGTLSLEFSTLKEEGLLLYAGPTTNFGPGDTFDFLTIKLHEGRVRVMISLGDLDPTLVTFRKSNKLSDGEWHLVEVYHNATFIRVVIDQCNSSVVRTSRTGQTEDRSDCEATKIIRNTKFRSLNINDPLQLGGVFGSPPDYIDVRPFTYDGCIRNVKENGIMMDLKDISNSKGSQEGCPIIDGNCPSPSPCSRNASCLPSRKGPSKKGFKCICPPGFGGSLCRNDSVEQTFEESSFITYRPLASFVKTYNPKFTQVQMMIRTRDEDGGPLLMIRDKQGLQRLMLRLTKEDNGKLSLEGSVSLGRNEVVVRLTNTLLGDGQWHHVTITRYRNEVHLGIDLNTEPRTAKGGGRDSFIQLELTRHTEIILGSAGSGNGFDGCMKDIRLNGETLPHNKSNKVAMVTKHREVKAGCHSRACDGNPCPETHFCYDEWREKKCLVRRCMSERLCLNGARCVDYGVKGEAMFECQCRAGFNGSRCDRGSQIIRLSADQEIINVTLVVGLSCFVLVLVLATLLIVLYHRHQTNGKATFDRAFTLSKLDKNKNSSKKSLVVVEWTEPTHASNKTNNSIKNLPPSKHFTQAHVHNTTRPSPVPVKTHPLEPEVTQHKPLSQLPAWDIPPMIDIMLSPDSDSSPVNEDYIEDPDETWQDAEPMYSRSHPDGGPTVSEQSPNDPEDSKLPAVTWNDIEEYGRKFYKLTRNFLARDDETRPSSAVSTTSNSSSVVTVVENPLA